MGRGGRTRACHGGFDGPNAIPTGRPSSETALIMLPADRPADATQYKEKVMSAKLIKADRWKHSCSEGWMIQGNNPMGRGGGGAPNQNKKENEKLWIEIYVEECI